MPRRDGTGPMGQGSMTGRGYGVCQGISPESYGFGSRRGMGSGLGIGMGYGCRRGVGGFFPKRAVGFSEKEVLDHQKEFFENRLSLVNKELENLSKREE